MGEGSPHIGVLVVNLHIPASQSLKEKRRVIKSLKDRLHHGFNVSVSEIGDLEKWQTAALGICMISNDKEYLNGSLEKALSLIGDNADAVITSHQIEFLQ